MSQPQKQPSRFERYIRRVAGVDSPKHPEYQEEEVTGKAIKIVTDGKLEKRSDEYKLVLELLEEGIKASTINQYISEIEDITKTLHGCISRLSGPYARSGDDERFAKMMRGWDKLYHNAMSKCQRSRVFFGSDDKLATKPENMTHHEISIRNLHLYFLHLVWPDAFDVLNYSFRDIDVTARSVTVIQTMGPVQRGEGLNNVQMPKEY